MEPNQEPSSSEGGHFTTPTRAKVQKAIEYAQARGNLHSKQDVFDFFGLGRTRGYAMLKDMDNSRRAHNTDEPENRGRPRHLSKEHID